MLLTFLFFVFSFFLPLLYVIIICLVSNWNLINLYSILYVNFNLLQTYCKQCQTYCKRCQIEKEAWHCYSNHVECGNIWIALVVTSTCSMMDKRYTHAKVLCDTFLSTTLPGIYVEIKMELFEQYMKPSEIPCRIEIFKKTFCGNKLFRKKVHTIRKEKDLHILAACLDDLKITYNKPTPKSDKLKKSLWHFYAWR